MSTSTQDKTNTSLPLPQERNSYTSTPYLVLTASMARKKWPQGWLTHPILLVKVCYRLSYFEEIIKGWGKCLAINDFHKTGSWCQDGLATEMTRFEFNFTFNLKSPCGSVSAGREKWPFNVLFFLKVEPPCHQT